MIQSETTENIRKALEVLREWNPECNLQYFMSEAELSAIEAVFPNKDIPVQLCREQAWMRCCWDHKHGLTQAEADSLLELLHACPWASPADGPNPAQYYNETISRLKLSQCGEFILLLGMQWLSSKWLPKSKCLLKSCRSKSKDANLDKYFSTPSTSALTPCHPLPQDHHHSNGNDQHFQLSLPT